MKSEEIETDIDKFETNQNGNEADILPYEMILDRVHSLLSHKPLNIGKNDYCYVRIVGNHLEIGRAKILLEE